MAGYGIKEALKDARVYKERKPRINVCGACGDECDSLLCDECVMSITSGSEDLVSQETRRGQ